MKFISKQVHLKTPCLLSYQPANCALGKNQLNQLSNENNENERPSSAEQSNLKS